MVSEFAQTEDDVWNIFLVIFYSEQKFEIPQQQKRTMSWAKMNTIIDSLAQTSFLFSSETAGDVAKLLSAMSSVIRVNVKKDGVETFCIKKKALAEAASKIGDSSFLDELEARIKL